MIYRESCGVSQDRLAAVFAHAKRAFKDSLTDANRSRGRAPRLVDVNHAAVGESSGRE